MTRRSTTRQQPSPLPRQPASPDCPCGSRQPFSRCCQPLLTGQARAADPQALMRSRYCAFALGYCDYLIATHDPAHLGGLSAAQLAEQDRSTSWIELQLISSGQTGEDSGTVHFIARFIEPDSLGELEEYSEFVRHQGRWYYRSGTAQFRRIKILTRNEICPCGSGKKYKRCHQQRG